MIKRGPILTASSPHGVGGEPRKKYKFDIHLTCMDMENYHIHVISKSFHFFWGFKIREIPEGENEETQVPPFWGYAHFFEKKEKKICRKRGGASLIWLYILGMVMGMDWKEKGRGMRMVGMEVEKERSGRSHQ